MVFFAVPSRARHVLFYRYQERPQRQRERGIQHCFRSLVLGRKLRFKLKMKKVIWLFPLLSFLGGCSRNYAINFPATQADAVGAWVLSNAPEAISNRFPAIADATLTLSSNHTATYMTFPVQKAPQSSNLPNDPAQWTLESGSGTWDFSGLGHNERHIWTVHLHTAAVGVQLTLAKRSGEA